MYFIVSASFSSKIAKSIASIGISSRVMTCSTKMVCVNDEAVLWIMFISQKNVSASHKKENELIASQSEKAAERVKNKRKLAIINWEIKILNSMTSFIDATSSHTKDDADEITNLRDWNKKPPKKKDS